MTGRLRARLVASSVAAVALCGCGVSNSNAVTQPAATTPSAATATATTTTPRAAAALTAREINRQDRPSRRLLERQQAAAAARPMLAALPITTQGVTIAIAGLADDGRTTLLTVRSRHGRAHALDIYARQLRRYGDDGHAYQPVLSR